MKHDDSNYSISKNVWVYYACARARKQKEVRPGLEDGSAESDPQMHPYPPRPALCRKTINRPLLSFEGNSVFITVSHDIWIQCCSELVVGADGKIPRSVTSHAVDPRTGSGELGHGPSV